MLLSRVRNQVWSKDFEAGKEKKLASLLQHRHLQLETKKRILAECRRVNS